MARSDQIRFITGPSAGIRRQRCNTANGCTRAPTPHKRQMNARTQTNGGHGHAAATRGPADNARTQQCTPTLGTRSGHHVCGHDQRYDPTTANKLETPARRTLPGRPGAFNPEGAHTTADRSAGPSPLPPPHWGRQGGDPHPPPALPRYLALPDCTAWAGACQAGGTGRRHRNGPPQGGPA